MAVAATLAVLTGGTFARDAVQPPVAGTSIHDFLSRHWKRPLAPQGTPPTTFSTLEASLAPESCGTCHPAQQADWKTSHHARAMRPGVTGTAEGALKERS